MNPQTLRSGEMKMKMTKTNPLHVIARWKKEDWDDDRMVAIRYEYENADTHEPIELTDKEAAQYSWGQTQDDITGGSQVGTLRESLDSENG